MQLNGTQVIDRHNRPSVDQKVALQAYFINDGVYQDPYEISGVAIYCKTTASAAQDFLNSDNLLASSTSSLLLMNFANSSVSPTASIFNTSNYTPGTTASGIYRTGVGKYIVILDGTVDLSGCQSYWNSTPTKVRNAASATGNYWDFWTVKLLENSNYKVVSNEFRLEDDTFFTITQPLLLRPKNKLTSKYVNLGSKTDLKFTTEITIENKDIDDSIKNIFRDSIITSACIQIMKLNDTHVVDSYVEVSGYTATSGVVDITSDNTIIFNWDTTKLYTHPKTLDGTLGSLTGPYAFRLKYNLLNELIISDPFIVILKST